MKFWTEYLLAWHRAIWFPFNWVMGLESPAAEMEWKKNEEV
jgi:hypothetical protein